MEIHEELEMLRKTHHDLQEYYYLLRVFRNDLEKLISNFRLTPDICKTEIDTKNPIKK